ncbi:copper homeostasis protein CutC [Gemmatimonas sp. UBA7669]|uniref:copper homeostasis protein CutC n=1 Tax=Gemmatimonas sp. UBA7669 TaxID=1946568 RepID=UPI0025BBC314|nr:copper homeostasis protein CutC [Gemmatimonas sp. UBA7669]
MSNVVNGVVNGVVNPDVADVLVEACCDSVETARAAQAVGAHRIELCGPGDGGSTPSYGLMARCRVAVSLPIHVMIRPHTGGFVYSEDDLDVMGEDIEQARMLGMNGVVVGPLHADGSVHREALSRLVSAAYPMRVAFHRAFDRTPNASDALTILQQAGVDVILTAGHARTALEGAATLRQLRAQAGDTPVILAGGSVRGDTVVPLVQASGVSEVHVRGTNTQFVRDVVAALAARSR